MAGQANISWNISEGDCFSTFRPYNNLYDFVIHGIITGTIIVGGIVCNSLAFVVFWKDNIKTSASFLFQSLALVDSTFLLLAFPLISVPALMTYKHGLNEYGEILAYILVYIRPL